MIYSSLNEWTFNNVLEKMKKVASSCNTPEQLDAAYNYCNRLANAYIHTNNPKCSTCIMLYDFAFYCCKIKPTEVE